MRLTRRWSHSGAALVVYASAAAFAVYFCMYAFRKPFDVVKFTGMHFLGGVELKTACVVSQILGYLLSKYLGAKVCSEVRPRLRAVMLLGLIAFAEAALLLFAILPPDGKVIAMFLNGLPLGMVWGLCVRYLEGRRATEVMLSGMCCSFIIAGAATRDIARDVVMAGWGVSEVWMPAVTGAVFLLPFAFAVALLDRVPPPSVTDVIDRSARSTMGREQRRTFLAHFGLGFVTLLVAYFLLTAFRDFRDHYGVELFDSIGLGDQRGVFVRTELFGMFVVIVAMAWLGLIVDHRRALIVVYVLVAAGFAAIGAATVAFQAGWLSGFGWMAAIGASIYLAYVPFNAVLFERMMAVSRLAGTSVFAIQLADGVGYTGSAAVQLLRDVAFGGQDRLAFFLPYAHVVSVAGVGLITVSANLVLRRSR